MLRGRPPFMPGLLPLVMSGAGSIFQSGGRGVGLRAGENGHLSVCRFPTL